MSKATKPTVQALEAAFDAESEWAEKQYGPHVTKRLTKPGRPHKGSDIEPTRPRSLRVQDSIWHALAAKAEKAGLTVNQAAQLALMEWANR